MRSTEIILTEQNQLQLQPGLEAVCDNAAPIMVRATGCLLALPALRTPMRLTRLCTIGVVQDIAAPISELQQGDVVITRLETCTGIFPTSRERITVIKNGLKPAAAGYAGMAAWLMDSLRRAGVELGTLVGIIGRGVEGELLSQLCSIMGTETILLDAGTHLAQAKKTIHPRLGVDVLFVTGIITDPKSWMDAFYLIRPGGRLIVLQQQTVTVPEDITQSRPVTIDINTTDRMWDDFTGSKNITHPYSYVRWNTARNLALCVDLIQQGKLSLDSLPRHEFTVGITGDAVTLPLPGLAEGTAILLHFETR